jgi:glycosyltransferase involved in cell wall biosynthesis
VTAAPVRILLLAHGYPPDEHGGTELYARALATELAALGHGTHVLAANPSARRPGRRIETLDGVEVERWRGADRAGQGPLPVDDPEAEQAFRAALARTRPDVVHAIHLLFLSRRLPLVARAEGVPTVVGLNDFWYLCPLLHLADGRPHRFRGRLWGASCFRHVDAPGARSFLSLVRRGTLPARLTGQLGRPRLMRETLAAADRLLAPSFFVRDRYVEFGVPPGAIDVLRLGLELDAAPVDRPARDGGVHVGFVGAFVEGKGADLLVDAFRRTRLPEARLTLRGFAPDPAYAQRLREAAGSDRRIEVGAPIPHEDLPAFLARLHLLVIPSRLHETFSRVGWEAARAGVPVLASRRGALPEVVVEGESGLLFEPDDPDDLPGKLRLLVGPPPTLDELRRFPEVKTMREHALELAELYRQLGDRRLVP